MMKGLLLLFVTGVFWCICGVLYSTVSRKKLDFAVVMSVTTALNSLLCWLFFVDYEKLAEQGAPITLQLTGIMFLVGILSSLAFIIVLHAMKDGHHGIIWTISQSAMVIPFLVGILLFNEPLLFWNGGGMLLVFFSFLIFGLKKNAATIENPASSSKWFWLSLSSFFVLGAAQAFSTVPSYWPGWGDAANLRPPLMSAGFALGYSAVMFFRKKWPNQETLKYSLLIVVFTLPSYFTAYWSMDALAAFNKVSLVYPVSVGISIVGFSFYSLGFLREKSNWSSRFGMIFALAGLGLLAF
jgi:drug/metabolite transporter (DMT)-like permease